ncbi:hypothetical protein ACGFNP_20640 [Nonomuraea sp. NPDC049269]|uniref:hypothetical protein n=1 Tax=Nonomuraea sp. NPDC049269 TaxID=3364349 RepID=UPI003713C4AC
MHKHQLHIVVRLGPVIVPRTVATSLLLSAKPLVSSLRKNHQRPNEAVLTPQAGGHDIPSAINSPGRPAGARSFIRTRRPGITSAHLPAATTHPGVCRMAYSQNSLGIDMKRNPRDVPGQPQKRAKLALPPRDLPAQQPEVALVDGPEVVSEGTSIDKPQDAKRKDQSSREIVENKREKLSTQQFEDGPSLYSDIWLHNVLPLLGLRELSNLILVDKRLNAMIVEYLKGEDGKRIPPPPMERAPNNPKLQHRLPVRTADSQAWKTILRFWLLYVAHVRPGIPPKQFLWALKQLCDYGLDKKFRHPGEMLTMVGGMLNAPDWKKPAGPPASISESFTQLVVILASLDAENSKESYNQSKFDELLTLMQELPIWDNVGRMHFKIWMNKYFHINSSQKERK